MVPSGNKAKLLLSVNHTTKRIHHLSAKLLYLTINLVKWVHKSIETELWEPIKADIHRQFSRICMDPGCGVTWGLLFGVWFIYCHWSYLLSSKDNDWLNKYIDWVVKCEVIACRRIWEVYTPVTWVSDVLLSEAFVTKGFFAWYLLTGLLASISFHFLFFSFLQMFLWLFWLVWILWLFVDD